MRAEDLMTRDVATLPHDASIGDAIELVGDQGVRHVPLLEGGRVVGVVSDRDLRRVEGLVARVLGRPDGADAIMAAPVATLLSALPVTVPPSLTVDGIIDRLVSERVGAVVVVDEGDLLLGIVSYIDVLQAARGKIG